MSLPLAVMSLLGAFLLIGSALVLIYPWLYKQLHPTKESLAWILADTPCLNSLDPNCLSEAAIKLAVNQTDSFPKITTLNNVANLQLKLGNMAAAKETALLSYRETTAVTHHYMLKRELTRLAVLLYELNEYEKYQDALERSLAIAKQSKDSHSMILDVAVWLCQSGMIEESRKVFVEALKTVDIPELKGNKATQFQYKIISELTSAGDIEGALSISKMTKHSESRDEALSNLSKSLSTRGQKEHAYRLASAIENPSLKKSTLDSIHEIWIRREGDVPEVLEYVSKVKSPYDRDIEMKLCVDGHIKSGHFQQAIAIAANIEDGEIYASAFEQIFYADKSAKPAKINIVDILRKIGAIEDTSRIANALIDLAYLQDRIGDIKGVAKTLDRLKGLDVKDGLSEYKKTQLYSLYLKSKVHTDAILREISLLPHGPGRHLSEVISLRLAWEGYFDEAIQVVEIIEPKLIKFRVLLEIAILQYKFSNGQGMKNALYKAQEIAWQIPNDAWVDYQRDISLERIVAIQVLAGLSEKAFENAQDIEYDMYRKKALRDIAVAKTILGDFRGALEMIWPLKDPQYILEIAEIMSNNYERGGRPTSGLCTLNTVIGAKYINWCYDYLM